MKIYLESITLIGKNNNINQLSDIAVVLLNYSIPNSFSIKPVEWTAHREDPTKLFSLRCLSSLLSHVQRYTKSGREINPAEGCPRDHCDKEARASSGGRKMKHFYSPVMLFWSFGFHSPGKEAAFTFCYRFTRVYH